MARSRASAKAAGSKFERDIADHLADRVDDRIDRRVKTGAKDRGDIGGVRVHGQRLVLECKNTTRINLGTWITEAHTEAGNDTPHHRATDAAYEATGKAFNFVAVRGIAKWMLEERGLTEQQATQAIVDTYRAGKPITKQVLGQLIDGYNQTRSGSERRLQQGHELVQRTMSRNLDHNPFEGLEITDGRI